MNGLRAPKPTVMHIYRKAWLDKGLHLSNFANSYHQYRDVRKWVGERPRILVIGPGQGLDTAVFRWIGCDVTTIDIDATFQPDVIGSCHTMPMFADGQFDVIIASHVLEHLAVPYLSSTLAEIARVGRYALLYLPVAGRHLQLRFAPGILGIDWEVVVDFFRYWERPDGINPRYCQGQHFWEVGRPGFRVADLCRRFQHDFELLDSYRNTEWIPSYNFVLRSRRNATAEQVRSSSAHR